MSNFKNLKIMSFSLGMNGALEGASKGISIGNAIPGIGTALGGIIRSLVVVRVNGHCCLFSDVQIIITTINIF